MSAPRPNPDRELYVTARDGEAARVVASRFDEVRTQVLEVPRRKRYDELLRLDLDVRPPADAEACAPSAPLDL